MRNADMWQANRSTDRSLPDAAAVAKYSEQNIRGVPSAAVATGRRVHNANGTWAARDVLLMGEFLAKIEPGSDAAYGS